MTGTGWRTIAIAVALIVLGAIEKLVGVLPIGQDVAGYILMVTGAVMAGMRAITTTALGVKPPPE